MVSKNSRLVWLDNLKVFLILLVVLGHSVQLLNPDEFQHDMVFRYIYSFHMPLFIFVSGFACYRTNVEWSLVKRRFIQLIVPFTVWSFVQCLINGHIRLWEMFIYPERSLWFLYVLFFITLLHVFLCSVSNRLKKKEELFVAIISIALLASMFVFKILGWPIISKYFLFYCMGFYARKYIRFERRSILLTLVLLLAFIISAYFCMQDSAPLFMDEGSSVLYKYPYNSYVALLGIAAFMLLFANYITKQETTLIRKIGEGTLGIYAIHRTVGLWLAGLMVKSIFNTCDLSQERLYFLYVLVGWGVIFAISWLIMILFEKIPFLSLLFLGKQIKK